MNNAELVRPASGSGARILGNGDGCAELVRVRYGCVGRGSLMLATTPVWNDSSSYKITRRTYRGYYDDLLAAHPGAADLNVYDMIRIAANRWFIGSSTGIYETSDNFTSWTLRTSTSVNCAGIRYLGSGNFVAVNWPGGTSGWVMQSADYGATWSSTSAMSLVPPYTAGGGGTALITDIASDPFCPGVACLFVRRTDSGLGTRYHLVYTSDYGATWQCGPDLAAVTNGSGRDGKLAFDIDGTVLFLAPLSVPGSITHCTLYRTSDYGVTLQVLYRELFGVVDADGYALLGYQGLGIGADGTLVFLRVSSLGSVRRVHACVRSPSEIWRESLLAPSTSNYFSAGVVAKKTVVVMAHSSSFLTRNCGGTWVWSVPSGAIGSPGYCGFIHPYIIRDAKGYGYLQSS